MEKLGKGLGPQSHDEEEIYAVERFRVDVQAALHCAMKAAGISQKELAKRMKVSPAHVHQIFDSGRNLTVRTVARVCFALEREPKFVLVVNCGPKAWLADESGNEPRDQISEQAPNVSRTLPTAWVESGPAAPTALGADEVA